MAKTVTRDHHNLRRNLKLNNNYISNDGGDEGITINDEGTVACTSVGTGYSLTASRAYAETTSGQILGALAKSLVNSNIADGATLTMYGLRAHTEVSSESNVGTINQYGIDVLVEGHTSGTETGYGMKLSITGSDTNYGIECLSADRQLRLKYDAASYLDVTVANDSHTTIATAETGNIVLNAGGDIDFQAEGNDITFKGGGDAALATIDETGLTINNITGDSAGNNYLVEVSGLIKKRTPAETLADIGGQSILVSTGTAAVSSVNYETLMPSVGSFYHRTGETDPEIFTRHTSTIIEKLDTDEWAKAYDFTPATITVTSPDGDDDWYAGSTHNITWTYENLTNNVRIKFSTNSGSSWSDLTADWDYTQPYPWTISATQGNASTYRIRVENKDDATVGGETADFDISTSTIAVVSPNGNEEWSAGDTQAITWTSQGGSGLVILSLYKDGILIGDKEYDIQTVATIDGANTFQWTIAADQATDANYRINIRDNNGSVTVNDFSDADFQIELNANIGITYPYAGQNYYQGQTHGIHWTEDVVNTANIDILLYKDGSEENVTGTSSPLIASNIPDESPYPWPVPLETPADDDYQIHIRKTATIAINGTSAEFDIEEYKKDIDITYPSDSGLSFTVGNELTITWTNDPLIEYIRLRLYSTSGGFLYDIVGGSNGTKLAADLGQYTWTIGEDDDGDVQSTPDAENYKIWIYNYDRAVEYDASNNNFTLTNPALTYPKCNSVYWVDNTGDTANHTAMIPIGVATTMYGKCTYDFDNTASGSISGPPPVVTISGNVTLNPVNTTIDLDQTNYTLTSSFTVTGTIIGNATMAWENPGGLFKFNGGAGAEEVTLHDDADPMNISFGQYHLWGQTVAQWAEPDADDLDAIIAAGAANSGTGSGWEILNSGHTDFSAAEAYEIGNGPSMRVFFAIQDTLGGLSGYKVSTTGTDWGSLEEQSFNGTNTFTWNSKTFRTYFTDTQAPGSKYYRAIAD